MKKFTHTDWFKQVIYETKNTLVPPQQRNFECIFNHLEVLNKEKYHIIETGSIRWDQNWKGEGQFTIIADKFVNYYDGIVTSVNNNKEHVDSAKQILSNKSDVVFDDSINFLQHRNDLDNVDVFYLDSYDLDWNNPTPSMEHHFNEFKTIIKKRTKGDFLLCVDDCNIPHGDKIIGKGKLIQDFIYKNCFFESSVLFNDYQFVCNITKAVFDKLKLHISNI